MKKYSLSYWVKQNMYYGSKPEDTFKAALDLFVNDPDKCPFEFGGSPIEAVNEIYIEWKKRGAVHCCLFPTPLNVARDMAILLGVGDEDVVFDPGCGLGNMLHAAQDRGAKAFGCEFQHWLPDLGSIVGLDVQRGDYLDGYTPGSFNVVMANPPFGRLGETSDCSAVFLDRLATQCTEDCRIGMILPRGYMNSNAPKARVAAIKKFDVLHSEQLDGDTFKPLTTLHTDLYVLKSLTPAREPAPQVCATGSYEYESVQEMLL